jgi:hypothetical protein
MVKQKVKNKKNDRRARETDNAYILKIVLFLIIGSQWIRLTDSNMTQQIPLPVGLLIGLFFAAHDHFQIDRKIEYAVLVLACLVGFWTQVGISMTILPGAM